jgi:hypothetical protein
VQSRRQSSESAPATIMEAGSRDSHKAESKVISVWVQQYLRRTVRTRRMIKVRNRNSRQNKTREKMIM